jgi:NAD(P)-dependent dehydrogenase (short-subunit alcohol dehydrogenase family)
MPSDNTPVWFITGCSSGLGRALAAAVLDREYRCAVTARDPKSVRDLVANRNSRALAIGLDVTDGAQIADAAAQAEAAFGRIDVLVNNAGATYLSSIEEGHLSEVRALFETNFFGLVRMIQTVLPGMRRRRAGCIVNISSIGGLRGLAGVGYYHATKFAVEGLSEALAQEVEPLGIRVLLVEPGAFRTAFNVRSARESRQKIEDYAKTAGATREQIRSFRGREPGDPARAAAAILKAVESTAAPLHLLLGRGTLREARAKLDVLRRDFEAWAETTVGADFPS